MQTSTRESGGNLFHSTITLIHKIYETLLIYDVEQGNIVSSVFDVSSNGVVTIQQSLNIQKSAKLSQKQSENGSKLFDTEYLINVLF